MDYQKASNEELENLRAEVRAQIDDLQKQFIAAGQELDRRRRGVTRESLEAEKAKIEAELQRLA